VLVPQKAEVPSQRQMPPSLSVIIPVFNEQESIDALFSRLETALNQLEYPWELLFIDDGSTDSSFQKLQKIALAHPQVKVIRFVRNFGQTAALAAGIDHASGQIVVPMDADLQNDPEDIKRLIAKLDEGYDVVSGWRKNRQDDLFMRLIPSWVANKLISIISGVPLHDYGCSLKAYRREVLQEVRLYGEMHRFVPIYASWEGAKVTEIPVMHHARQFGRSKYGISRTLKVLLDLVTVKFMSTYFTKPIYVFGTAGLVSLGLSFAAFIWMVSLKIFEGTSFIKTPLPVLITMFFVVGVQFILMGLLAEILMRTYHEAQDKRIYTIKNSLNLPESSDSG
jgi:glycosyltransferase involved in cell wall biosynthesis